MIRSLPEEDRIRAANLIKEVGRRQAKDQQSKRGWYDKDGIRQGGLIAFVRCFWKVLEPETPFTDGWVLWAMCEHLEAVTFGDINRLMINVPPGTMKSLLTNVFWPAFEWGPMNKAHLRYVTFSYSATLTERDNNRFTSLITSAEYQALYGDRVKAVKVGERRVSNTRKGWKLASSIGGVATGERGDRIILDDPNSVGEADSEVIRASTIQWFRESMSNRLNDMRNGAIVGVMQRVHADDISGCILSLGLDYCHLCIPMEYDWARQTNAAGEAIQTDIGWVDPRYVPNEPDECDGTLAWPERFPPEVIAQTKEAGGPYMWAGQYQQQPAPRGGGIFKRSWWQLWEHPEGKFPVFEYLLASLDSAYTQKEENDPSAMTVWGIFRNEHDQRRIMLVHAWRKHLQFSADRSKIERTSKESVNAWRRRSREHWGLMEWVVDTCERFKVDKLLIEAKASGISAAQELANRFGLQKWSVQLCPVSGDKYARAIACQPTFSQLMVYAPERDWSELVIEEMEVFPKHKYDDLCDSASQGIKHLRDMGLAQTDEEAHVAEVDNVRQKSKVKAIYPI